MTEVEDHDGGSPTYSNSSNYDDDYINNEYLDDFWNSEENQILARNLSYCLLAVLGVATVLSVIVVIGLLIPLFIQLKNGTFYQTTRRSGKEPPYSTYNLYLVYSAFIDLFYLVIEIIQWTKGMRNISHELAMDANLWINAVIVYEVLVLLRASKNARRINQPSLMKVNLQAGGIIVGTIGYIMLTIIFEDFFLYDHVYIQWVVYFIPILFVIGVTIFVKCKAYLPPTTGTTPRDKAVRGLALFFFRVILLFLVIWIPIFVLILVAGYGGPEILYAADYFLSALQPILNFCLILSKPDVKKYITDLVALNCIFGNCKKSFFQKSKGTPTANANQEHRRRNTTTVLGYTFSGVDNDDSDAIGNDPGAGDSDDARNGNNQDMETAI